MKFELQWIKLYWNTTPCFCLLIVYSHVPTDPVANKANKYILSGSSSLPPLPALFPAACGRPRAVTGCGIIPDAARWRPGAPTARVQQWRSMGRVNVLNVVDFFSMLCPKWVEWGNSFNIFLFLIPVIGYEITSCPLTTSLVQILETQSTVHSQGNAAPSGAY